MKRPSRSVGGGTATGMGAVWALKCILLGRWATVEGMYDCVDVIDVRVELTVIVG